MLSEQHPKVSATNQATRTAAPQPTDALTLEGERVVMVEFNPDGQPHMVHTTKAGADFGRYFHHYDVDYCKRDDCYYYHMSGGGPSLYLEGFDHWVLEGFAHRINGNHPVDESRRILDLPSGMADLLAHMNNEETVWCSRCSDCFPETETCGHVWWCERCGWWSTPDSRRKDATDRCGHRRSL